MPKVTIEISDAMKSGKPTCNFGVRFDTENHPNDAPATLALLMAATIRELVVSGVLERLIPLVEAKESLRAHMDEAVRAAHARLENDVINVDSVGSPD